MEASVGVCPQGSEWRGRAEECPSHLQFCLPQMMDVHSGGKIHIRYVFHSVRCSESAELRVIFILIVFTCGSDIAEISLIRKVYVFSFKIDTCHYNRASYLFSALERRCILCLIDLVFF